MEALIGKNTGVLRVQNNWEVLWFRWEWGGVKLQLAGMRKIK